MRTPPFNDLDTKYSKTQAMLGPIFLLTKKNASLSQRGSFYRCCADHMDITGSVIHVFFSFPSMRTENGAYDTVQKEEAVTKAIKMTARQLLLFL